MPKRRRSNGSGAELGGGGGDGARGCPPAGCSAGSIAIAAVWRGGAEPERELTEQKQKVRTQNSVDWW